VALLRAAKAAAAEVVRPQAEDVRKEVGDLHDAAVPLAQWRTTLVVQSRTLDRALLESTLLHAAVSIARAIRKKNMRAFCGLSSNHGLPVPWEDFVAQRGRALVPEARGALDPGTNGLAVAVVDHAV